MTDIVIRSQREIIAKIALLNEKKKEAHKRKLTRVIEDMDIDIKMLTDFLKTYRLPENKYENARLWLVGNVLTTLDD